MAVHAEDDDGEYADLFQSSGEEYRSEDDVYVDDDEEEDDDDGELKVSSAIAADAQQRTSSKKKRRGNTKSSAADSGRYADEVGAEEDDDDDPDREALLQSCVKSKCEQCELELGWVHFIYWWLKLLAPDANVHSLRGIYWFGAL